MRSKCSAKSPKDAGEHADAKLLRQVARRKIKFLSLTSLQGADIRASQAASFQESGGEVVLAQLDGGAHHGVAELPDAPERAELGVMASVQLLDVGSRLGLPEDEARALFEQGRTVAAATRGRPRRSKCQAEEHALSDELGRAALEQAGGARDDGER